MCGQTTSGPLPSLSSSIGSFQAMSLSVTTGRHRTVWPRDGSLYQHHWVSVVAYQEGPSQIWHSEASPEILFRSSLVEAQSPVRRSFPVILGYSQNHLQTWQWMGLSLSMNAKLVREHTIAPLHISKHWSFSRPPNPPERIKYHRVYFQYHRNVSM